MIHLSPEDARSLGAELAPATSVVLPREVPGLPVHAKVWVTVFDPGQADESIEVLKRSAGFLRRRLGQELRMRVVPELHFKHDRSVETGRRMDDLISRAKDADASAQRGRNEPEDSDPEK